MMLKNRIRMLMLKHKIGNARRLSEELMKSLIRDEGWREMGVYHLDHEPKPTDFLKIIDDEARNLNKVTVLHLPNSAKDGKSSPMKENGKS